MEEGEEIEDRSCEEVSVAGEAEEGVLELEGLVTDPD